MGYLFTSESASEGHLGRVADQISDAVLGKLLTYDSSSRVAYETLVIAGQVVLIGEVKTKAHVDLQPIACEVIKKISYTKDDYMFKSNSCGVLSVIHGRSPDINRDVGRQDPMEQGIGDQGTMFGYATNKMESYMPLSLDLAHRILQILADIRREDKTMTYLRPDSKSQVTIGYDDNGNPVRVDTIVASTQHSDFTLPVGDSGAAQLKVGEEMLGIIRNDVINILMPRVITSIHHEKVLSLFNNNVKYRVNPTDGFVIGGPHGDTGLTGREIAVNIHGSKGAHSGGAFSGKDPSKVDCSATYATRRITRNLVTAGVADEMLMQVSYATSVTRPINVYANAYGCGHVNMSDGKMAKKINEIFDLRPEAAEDRLRLHNPIYQDAAAHGCIGREPQIVTEYLESCYKGDKDVTVKLFTWKKLDYVNKVRVAFGL